MYLTIDIYFNDYWICNIQTSKICTIVILWYLLQNVWCKSPYPLVLYWRIRRCVVVFQWWVSRAGGFTWLRSSVTPLYRFSEVWGWRCQHALLNTNYWLYGTISYCLHTNLGTFLCIGTYLGEFTNRMTMVEDKKLNS